MKRCLFFITLCITVFTSHAQTAWQGFKPENNELIWQHVYETRLTPQEVLSYFETSGIFETCTRDETRIWGPSKQKKLNCQAAGVNSSTLGNHYGFLNYPVSYSITIEAKDNRYRVTLKNIVAHPDISIAYMGISTNSNIQISANDQLYNFRKGKFKNSSGCIAVNQCLTNEFTIPDISHFEQDDNW